MRRISVVFREKVLCHAQQTSEIMFGSISSGIEYEFVREEMKK